MLKKMNKFICAIILIFGLNMSLYAEPVKPLQINQFEGVVAPQINARSYVLIDADTGMILTGANYNERLYPASLTKIMTSYVAGDALYNKLIHNEDLVTVTENAWAKKFPSSSKMFLEINKQVTVSDLLKGIIVVSGNDACVALAEHIAGSEASFVEKMNYFASKLGLKNTNFTSAHGLDNPNQYSSALDMALLSRELIKNFPQEYKIHSQKEFTYNKISQKNRNGLLWDTSINVDGVKTGHTDQAGFNMVVSATKDNLRLITVVFGVNSFKGREIESKKLLQWGFSNFTVKKVAKGGQSLVSHPIYYGTQNHIKLGNFNDINLVVPKNFNLKDLNVSYALLKDQVIKAPIKKGAVIGKINFVMKNKKIHSLDLLALEDVAEAGWFGKFIDWVWLLF